MCDMVFFVGMVVLSMGVRDVWKAVAFYVGVVGVIGYGLLANVLYFHLSTGLCCRVVVCVRAHVLLMKFDIDIN